MAGKCVHVWKLANYKDERALFFCEKCLKLKFALMDFREPYFPVVELITLRPKCFEHSHYPKSEAQLIREYEKTIKNRA